jgi:MFS family permease
MTTDARTVQRTYLLLTLLTTLAASFIWGINTLFLLDAGLTNTEAFAANAFFAVGQVIFEVPTGVVADTRGRRFSFLLGALTLLASTLLYFVMWQVHAAFIGWALASILLGLGFTFFSGATEAWLVDALGASGFSGNLESVFGRAQTVGGIAMLVGSVLGGVVAQLTDLGVPYVLRAVLLGVTLIVAWRFMHDIGFAPRRGASPVAEVRSVVRGSIDAGLRNPPVRWLMLATPFTTGVGFFAFYALQPYLLELYGDPGAYGVAGLAAAIFAGAQIVGGLIVPRVRRLFRRRTDALLIGTAANVLLLRFAHRFHGGRGRAAGAWARSRHLWVRTVVPRVGRCHCTGPAVHPARATRARRVGSDHARGAVAGADAGDVGPQPFDLRMRAMCPRCARSCRAIQSP